MPTWNTGALSCIVVCACVCPFVAASSSAALISALVECPCVCHKPPAEQPIFLGHFHPGVLRILSAAMIVTTQV